MLMGLILIVHAYCLGKDLSVAHSVCLFGGERIGLDKKPIGCVLNEVSAASAGRSHPLQNDVTTV